ncbi:MAG TPA: phosphonate C-P lyase system protein PhnH [Magnetospirillaceae bacterium]|jgi:alpha-D-ribose 1-methylphosphonate 5-triphosphate synthase subunit PhnH
MSTETLAPGFADPVLDAQRVFRAVLDAMARPGTIIEIPSPSTPPEPVMPAVGAVLLSLADHETPVWIDHESKAPGFSAWLGFHCGSRLVSEPGQAMFALVIDAATMPPLSAFEPGSEEYPDRSATIIVQVPSLTGGEGWTITGPGIRDRIAFGPAGLPAAFKDWIVENNAHFPQGVDLIFASGNRIAALPRSTRLKG